MDRLILDYPATAQKTPLVGPIERGGTEPAVGCLISWRLTPGAGQAGLAFGVEDRNYLTVLIDAGKTLIVDGTDIGANRLVRTAAGAVGQGHCLQRSPSGIDGPDREGSTDRDGPGWQQE